jgi:hypothetical protein
MDLMILVVGLLALGLSTLRWGVDGGDGVQSPEWERRRDWLGLAGGGSALPASREVGETSR